MSGRHPIFDHEDHDILIYSCLLTEFASKLDGAWIFYRSTVANIGRLKEQAFANPEVKTDRHRQERAWGSVFEYRALLRELMIIHLAKTVEDCIGLARNLAGAVFAIWQNDELRLAYHEKARCVWALNNVIKHHSARIPDGDNHNAKYLIEHCGLRPGQEIAHLDFDIERFIFYVHTFLDDLSHHLAGLRRGEEPADEEQAFRAFGDMMNVDMPWHPFG